jgi:CubicO group peptidase (beta-lactamase class C family)
MRGQAAAGSGATPGRRCAVAAVALGVFVSASCARTPQPPPVGTPAASPSSRSATPTPTVVPEPVVPQGDFAGVAQLVDDAVAVPRLPGAVVQIGHGGKVVFRQAFGARKLPGEPGLDGAPAPAEPMTEDTLFDLASLTKILSTTTALLQLYEAGKVGIDDPLEKYLPEFNPAGDPRRSEVTLRMVLTHTSGIAGDLSRDGPWGLTAADKNEGIRRALNARVEFPPGEIFHYSDIGFILLGTIVEQITGQTLDVYARDHIFAPLGMADTHYLPGTMACGPHRLIGNAIAVDPSGPAVADCPEGTWNTGLLRRVAPTARDEDTPGINPDIDRPLRGTVHDPTARRMGGVAGSAGVFSTVHDVGRYTQGLLDRLAGRPSTFPLKQSTLELMTTPQQPGHEPGQVEAANIATRNAIATAPNAADPLLAPEYPAVPGQDLRGLGWDIDTPHSRPRGMVFPVGSFGHTGFTGVTVWLDPGSDTYVVVLGNVIHQRGGPPIAGLSGDIATTAARALHLYGS